jgi:nucleoside 2-deoxyribosyltransferase
MIKVYIASPFTKGDKVENVNKQIEVASILIDHGACVIWPLASHFINKKFPKSYETWMQQDFELLGCCDVLLRLDGESEGADREVNYAIANNIDCFFDLDELLWYIDKEHSCHDRGV